MNDSMTSVADIPDDANDDLSGISPELVLVDPELARLAREREAVPTTPALTRGSTLRLVRAGDSTPDATEAPIVPRPTAPAVEPAAGPPTHAAETADAQPARSVASSTPPIDVEPAVSVEPALPSVPAEVEPEPEPVVQQTRIVEAEPARALEPPRRDIPSPLAEPVRPSRPETLQSPEPSITTSREMTLPVMPHPVARPTGAAPTRRTSPPRRKGGRRGLALLAAVAVASVAVLGFLQLTSRSPDSAGDGGGRSAVGTPPSAKPTPTSKAQVAKTKAKAKVAAKASPKPKSTTKPATHQTGATGGAAQTGSAKPKAAAPKPTQPKASQPKTSQSKPTQKPVESKPATRQPPNVSSGTARSPVPKPVTSPVPASQTRRFAWAPVDGATGYHVELFRGADRVLAQETKDPVLELGSSWRYEGKTVQLTPGTYRWYVWPVTKSGRATEAVVQAKLDIP